MAEELDEFGIPIRKKKVEVDEFGIPIKKKNIGQTASTGLATNGGTSANGSSNTVTTPLWTPPYRAEVEPFNMAQASNPELVKTVKTQQTNKANKLSGRLKEINQVYDIANPITNTQASSQASDQKDVERVIANTEVDNLPYDGRALNVAKGLNTAYEGLLKIPRFLYGVAAVPQNALADVLDMPQLAATYDDFLKNTNVEIADVPVSPLTMLDQLGDYYGKEAKGYGERTKKYDENIIGAIQDGNWKQAGNQILDQIAESAPSIAVMAMTSGAGNTAKLGQVSKTLANALPFMSQRNAELQDDKSVPEWLKPINAGLNGLSEVIFDQSFGTQAAIQGIVNRFANEGRDAAVNAAKEFTSSFMNGALKGAKVIKPFVNGAIEEGTTQLAQNIVDKYTTNPDIDLMEGVADAMIVGSAMTGSITSAGNLIPSKQRKQLTELETQQRALLTELDNPNITPEAKEGVTRILEENNNSIESIAKETRDAIARLNPEQKKQVEDLNEKVNVAEAVVNDPSVTPEVKAVAEKQVESLSKEIDAIKPEEPNNETTPIKKATDVVVDDTIELVNGKQGKVTKVEGNQITMTMPDGSVFMATPDLIEMSKVTPIEAVQETITPETAQSNAKVKESIVEPKKETVEKGTFLHGSPQSGLTEFDSKYSGMNTNVESAKGGIWVTNSRDVAETYRDWKNPIEKGKTGDVYDVNVDVRNPLYTEDTNESGRNKAIKQAKENGNDSVVFTDDNGNKHIFIFDPKKATLANIAKKTITNKDLKDISDAFSKRFGIKTKIVSKQEADNILKGKNSKDIFFQILDEVDVFDSKDVSTAKLFIDKVFRTVESEKDAKAAFRKLAVKYHPDKMGSEEIMKHLNDVNEKYKSGALSITPQGAKPTYGTATTYSNYDDFSKDIFEQFKKDTDKSSGSANRYKDFRTEPFQAKYDTRRESAPKTPPTPEPTPVKKDGIFDNIKEYFRKKTPEELRKKAKDLSEQADAERRSSEKKATEERDKSLANIKAKYKENYSEQATQNKIVLDRFYEKMQSIKSKYDTQVSRANDINNQSYNLQVNDSKIAGFYDKATRTAFLVEGAADETTAIHEIFSHPFIEVIEQEHPELFKNLLNEAKSDPQVLEYVNSNYVEASDITKSHEYIAAAIDLNAKGRLKNKTLVQYINEFWKEVKAKLSEVFGKKVTDFDKGTSIDDIVKFVLESNEKLNLNESNQTTKEVVTEDISQKRTQEVLTKANTDLEALKQVQNKPAKYQASVKRLNDAFRAGEITEQEFNDTKARFDDVIAESSPNVPKKESLTKQEITELDNELKNENLTTDDFIQFERTRAIEDANNVTEAVQQPSTNREGSTGETQPSEEVQGKAGDTLRRFAQKAREGKINKLGGFKAATGFDGAWDIGLEAVALSLEGGAKVADAIESGLKAIKQTDWYKKMDNKAEFDSQYKAHMENEYQAEEREAKATTGINQTNIDATREELGLDEVKRLRKADAERNAQADKWVEDGNSIPDLLKRLEKGGLPTDVENVVLRKYISSLEARNNKNPTPELLSDINRATRLVTESRSELGRALRAGVGEVEVVDNLSNFLLQEMDAFGIDSLPQSVIDDLKAKYAKGQEAKEAWEAGYQKALDEFTKQQAQVELDKAKVQARRKAGGKKTKEEYAKERQAYKDNIRKKLREARSQANAVPVPYLNELIAISPEVAKIVRSYIEEGISNLDEIIKKVHSDLEEDIPDITEQDVRDLIAGQYNQKRPTQNEIAATLRDLRQQAKLLKRIDDLESGVQPVNDVAKIQRSKQIESLQKQVKDIEDRVGVTDAKTLKARRTSLENKIAQLKEYLETGNFDLEPAQPRKLKLDEETQKALDEYNEFLKETYKRRDQARYAQLPKWRKAWDKVQQVLGLRRLVQTSLDFSMPFRQAVVITLNPRQYGIGRKNFTSLEGLLNTPKDIKDSVAIQAWRNMFRGTFSPKYFERVMAQIKGDPDYRNMMEDKLVFSEVDSADNLNREEDYRTSFLYEIPYLRQLFLGSNRAAAGFVNTARYELYKNGVDKLRRQGVTRENSPESYKALAKWAMNATGRGNMLEFLENSPQAQRILGDTFYGVRLMSSRFNLLNPNYYAKMPKEVRVEALKDMASFASTLAVTLLAAGAAGASVSLNPEDPDFLKARWGDKRYDLTGGMTQYMRTFYRLVKALSLNAMSQVNGDKKEAKKYGSFALKSGANFFRYKLAPNTAYALSGVTGTDAMGEDFNPQDVLNITPMYTEDMKEAFNNGEGAIAGFTIFIPNIFGIGVQEYDNKKK